MVIAFMYFDVLETNGRSLEEVTSTIDEQYADVVARSADNRSAPSKKVSRVEMVEDAFSSMKPSLEQ